MRSAARSRMAPRRARSARTLKPAHARPRAASTMRATMDGIPLKQFIDLLSRGIATPRPVVRRMIDARPGPVDRVMLVGLAAALQGALWAAVGVLAPGMFQGAFSGGLGFSGHLALAGLVFVNYAITTAAAIFFGGKFGGRGASGDVATAVAWHSVLAAALTPLQAIGFGSAGPEGALGPGSALFVLLFLALNIWLLASCVAEAHGFASTGRVAAAVIGLFFVFGFAVSLLIAATQ